VLGSQAYGLVRVSGTRLGFLVWSVVNLFGTKTGRDRRSASSVRYRCAESAPVPDRLCRLQTPESYLVRYRYNDYDHHP
jgi:hypothetical protein